MVPDLVGPNNHIKKKRMNLQVKKEKESAVDVIPQDVLRKYILYAREKVHPVLSDKYVDKMSNLFAEMRKESLVSLSFCN